MDFFDILKLIGGLAIFIYGMDILGKGLQHLAGGKLEKILSSLTNNKFKGVLLGTLVTAAIQSSSATTVMTVGLVNAGLIKLQQAVGVIMGANIGTTVTAWLLSLVGIESDNFFLRMLKPESFTPILALVGIILLTQAKKQKSEYIGNILLGFSVLMMGMETMSTSMKPLAGDTAFQEFMTSFTHPVLGFLTGLLVTSIIQSSSAATGILQALSVSGGLLNSQVIPIILGINIGTCVTALLSSIGTGINARRTAIVHLEIKTISAVTFLIAYIASNAIWNIDYYQQTAGFISIALIHTVFNLASTLMLIGFTDQLVKLSARIIKGSDPEEDLEAEFKRLDSTFLSNPGFAISVARDISNNMAAVAKKSIDKSLDLLNNYDHGKMKKVEKLEKRCDRYEDKLGSYLINLTSRSLSIEDSKTLSRILYNLSDFERISDHAVNIAHAAAEMHEKKLKFSAPAKAELDVYMQAVKEITQCAYEVYVNNDIELASMIEPLEETVDSLADAMQARHIKRLRAGLCTIEMGFILSDIITAIERVSDHCSNIGASVIEINAKSLDTHAYIKNLKKSDKAFNALYTEYRNKYTLPGEELYVEEDGLIELKDKKDKNTASEVKKPVRTVN